MLNRMCFLALSVSVATLAAGPAMAQVRKVAPTPQAAPIAPNPLPAPQKIAPETSTDTRFEFSLPAGFRLMSGQTSTLGTKTVQSTDSKQDVTAGPPNVTISSGKSPVTNENLAIGNQIGYAVGGSGTLWLGSRVGIGVDYAFNSTWGSVEGFQKLGLQGSPDTNKIEVSGGTTTTTNVTRRESYAFNSIFINSLALNYAVSPQTTNTTVTPGGGNNTAYEVVRTNLSLPNLNFTAANPGGQVNPVANQFVTTKDEVPNAPGGNQPTTKYTASGRAGATRGVSSALHIVDSLSKTVIASNEQGELQLLAGLSVPILQSNVSTVHSVTGESGSGTAKQTTVYKDPTTATNNFTEEITVESTVKQDISASTVAVGPMLGLGGKLNVTEAFQVYGRFGYVPALFSTTNGGATTTVKGTVVREITDAGTTAANPKGTKSSTSLDTTENSTNAQSTFSGVASTFVLGGRYQVTEALSLNVEASNQTYTGATGGSFTGLNAGISMGF